MFVRGSRQPFPLAPSRLPPWSAAEAQIATLRHVALRPVLAHPAPPHARPVSLGAALHLPRTSLQMKASTSSTPEGGRSTANDQMLERTLRVAQLLSEALVLLGQGRAPLSAPPTRRGSDRLLRLPEVRRLTGLCRSTIYQKMQRGIFPRSVKVGPRAAGWSEASVQAWIADRLDGR